MWIIKFTKNADKDKKLIKSAGLEDKVKKVMLAFFINKKPLLSGLLIDLV